VSCDEGLCYGSMKNARVFTLIELLATVTIMAILVGMALPLARNSVKREREIELRQALHQMRKALDDFKQASDEGKIEKPNDTEGYPQTLDQLVDGVQM